MIDIEGGEFDLFNADTLRALRHSTVFVELHTWPFPDARMRLHKLRSDAEPYFTITEITTGTRDLSHIPEIRHWTDNDSWLLCSEAGGHSENGYVSILRHKPTSDVAPNPQH